MNDAEFVAFLRWTLPRLGLRWEGFRGFRRQVRRRVTRRMAELGLESLSGYRDHLEANAGEWERLRRLYRVTISRLYRDERVFSRLQRDVLPRLARAARDRGDRVIRAWSAGCAGGEEAYSLAVSWRARVARDFEDVRLHVLATDIDEVELDRARRAEYPAGAARELPADLREEGFDQVGEHLRVREPFRDGIEFCRGDLVTETPRGPFDLVLCRNVVFTYFDATLQRAVAERLAAVLRPGGVLVIGQGEAMPRCDALAVLYPDEKMYTTAGAGSEDTSP